MADKQPIVAATGLGLVLANYWLGGARQQVSAGVFNKSASAQETSTAHTTLAKTFAELAFVLVATLIAGVSDAAGSAMLAVLFALGVLWAMNHFSGAPAGSSAPSVFTAKAA